MKKRILYLGDLHGNFELVNQYIDKFEIKNAHIIQVGDFGVGFKGLEKEKRALVFIHNKLVKNNIFLHVIRGNHDFKPYFDNDPFGFTNIKLLPDYTVLNLEGKNILCIGGAVSVDRKLRYTKSQKAIFNNPILESNFQLSGDEIWWSDEKFVIDNEKLKSMRDIDIVVTHTAPSYCTIDNSNGYSFFVEGIIRETNDSTLKKELSIERKELDDAFHSLKIAGNDIKHHYYGHFHRSDVLDIYGTKHRLLNIGELWEEELDEYYNNYNYKLSGK